MSYNPLEYWNAVGNRGYMSFEYHGNQEQDLLKFLQTFDFKTVLEIGCGYGRITDIILRNFDIQDYLALDISVEQLVKATRYTKSDKIRFQQCDITHPLSLDRKYDLVIAVEVLMHIRPEDILQVIGTMLSYSSKHTVNVDYYTNKDESLASHNFKHEYKMLYAHYAKNVDIIKLEDIRQCIFHASNSPIIRR